MKTVKNIALVIGLASAPWYAVAQQPAKPARPALNKQDVKKVEKLELPTHVAPPVTKPKPEISEPMRVLKVVDDEVYLGQAAPPDIVKALTSQQRAVKSLDELSAGAVFEGKFVRVLSARNGLTAADLKRFKDAVGKDLTVRLRDEGAYRDVFLGIVTR